MTDAIRGEYVAKDFATLRSVVVNRLHKTHDVARFEFYQIPVIDLPEFIKEIGAKSDQLKGDHNHSSLAKASCCKFMACAPAARLAEDPRVATAHIAHRLAPIFLCHRMWYKSTKDQCRYECRVPLRCFLFMPPPSTLPRGSLETRTTIYNNSDKSVAQKGIGYPWPLALTLLAESAACVFNLTRFTSVDFGNNGEPKKSSPTQLRKMDGAAAAPVSWANVARTNASSTASSSVAWPTITPSVPDYIFYGDDGDQSGPCLTLTCASNYHLHQALPHDLRYHTIHSMKTTVKNAFAWHGIRNSYHAKHTDKKDVEPSVGSWAHQYYPNYFFSDTTRKHLDKLDKYNGVQIPDFLHHLEREMIRLNSRILREMPRFSGITNPRYFKHLSNGVHYSTQLNRSHLEVHYGDKKRALPENKATTYASGNQKERFTFNHYQSLEDGTMAVDLEFTRITTEDKQTYWALSSVTVSLDPDTWKRFYSTAPPPTTLESDAEFSGCVCCSESNFPPNVMGFEAGVNKVRTLRPDSI